MKHFFFFLIAMLPIASMAQINYWFPKVAVTDSIHNNKNTSLYGTYPNSIMFWDQQLDGTTTQLCYKSLNFPTIGDQSVALHQAGVNLTHPQILKTNGTQPFDYLVVYQTNEGNDIDLKAIGVQQNGIFSTPIDVASLPGDDLNAAASAYGIVAWENNGKLYSTMLLSDNSFSVPHAIDSLGSHSPTFTSNNLSYLKPKGDSTQIVTEQLNYNQGVWEITDRTTQSFFGTASNLSSYPNMYPAYNLLCMENKVGTMPSGLIILGGWNTALATMNSPTHNLSQPKVAEYLLGVKAPMDYILAYISDSLGQNEIFVQTPFFYPTFNISQWPGDDLNPYIAVSYPGGDIVRVNLFWESIHSGFSTIYYSHFDYTIGGIDENPSIAQMLFQPCPFKKETTIKVQMPNATSIQAFDLQGNLVKTLKPENDSNGWSKVIWDGTNEKGLNVAPGSYLIVARNKNAVQSRIVIKE